MLEQGVEANMNFRLNTEDCPYSIRVFPSQVFYDQYNSRTPTSVTIAVAMVFVFTTFMFFLYDRLVERRQEIIMKKAVQSSTILASLFPKNIRDRLMADVEKKQKKGDFMAPNHRLKSFLTGNESDQDEMGQHPIADLFPYA